MRRLLLLRHAEAASHAGGGDRERPLTSRGRLEAARLGKWLASEHIVPDFAASSDARRTRETLELIASESHFRLPCAVEPRLYDASPPTLLGLMRQARPVVRTLLAVGHNPGFADFASESVGYGDRYALSRMRAGFPPGALAIIDYDADDWSRIAFGEGRLDRFITPDWLEHQAPAAP